MNTESYQGLNNLVAEYESMSETGYYTLFDEKEFSSLITYYEGDGRYEKALEVVDFALNCYQYSIDFYLRKSVLLFERQQLKEALKTLDKAEVMAPEEKTVLLLKAEILTHLELPFMALAILDKIKNTVSGESLGDVLLLEALVYEQQEQYECMFYALKAAIMANPSHHLALEKLWTCIEMSKNYKHSVAFHKEVIDMEPYSYRAWFNLGLSYEYLGKYELAVDAYEFVMAINPDFEPVYKECGDLCFQLKWYHKSLKFYAEHTELFIPCEENYLHIGNCHQQLGSYNVAQTFYARVLQLDPLNDEAHFRMGECYAHIESWKAAVVAFEKALQIETKREEYYVGLAEAYHRLFLPVLADQNFLEALELAPERLDTWVQYIRFLLDSEETEAVFQALNEAKEYTREPEVMYCKAACLFAMGRRREAFYWMVQALDDNFDKHLFLFTFMPDLSEDLEIRSLISAYQAP